MKKLFIILFSVFFLFTLTSSNTTRTGLVTIQYLGDVDKPYPLTTLYLPGTHIRYIDFIDSISYFVYQTEITEPEFDSVSKIIETSRFESKIDSLSWSILFTIITNDKKKFYETRDKTLIKEILKKIINQIKSSGKDETVKYPLENLMRRLGIS